MAESDVPHHTDGGWDLFSLLAQCPEHHKYSLICGHLFHGLCPCLSLEERYCPCFMSLHILPRPTLQEVPSCLTDLQTWHLQYFNHLSRLPPEHSGTWTAELLSPRNTHRAHAFICFILSGGNSRQVGREMGHVWSVSSAGA